MASERAESHASTVTRERAVVAESTASVERAESLESTVARERADEEESTVVRERAVRMSRAPWLWSEPLGGRAPVEGASRTCCEHRSEGSEPCFVRAP
jgi:hypothetical protein